MSDSEKVPGDGAQCWLVVGPVSLDWPPPGDFSRWVAVLPPVLRDRRCVGVSGHKSAVLAPPSSSDGLHRRFTARTR